MGFIASILGIVVWYFAIVGMKTKYRERKLKKLTRYSGPQRNTAKIVKI